MSRITWKEDWNQRAQTRAHLWFVMRERMRAEKPELWTLMDVTHAMRVIAYETLALIPESY